MSKFLQGGFDDSSTESSSDEEELYSDEEEEEKHQAKGKDSEVEDEDEDEEEEDSSEEGSSDEEGGKKFGAAKFLRDASSESEESDEEHRGKVKSAKDKRLDELEAIIDRIDTVRKNNDWHAISQGRTRKPAVAQLAANVSQNTISLIDKSRSFKMVASRQRSIFSALRSWRIS
jgi:translation initiation factor 3 subunit C